jgi:hypothetical protein
MSDWQPIDTAPKDGTEILLFDGEVVTVGGWISEVDQGADYEGQGLIAPGWWSLALKDNKPTHWQPLPPPPVTPQEPQTP